MRDEVQLTGRLFVNPMPASATQSPFISILIPTYRRLKLLNDVLSVCIEQSAPYGNLIEIVVIDNCRDGSAEGAVSTLIPLSHTCVRYVKEPRKGIATVRNTALRVARGKYVIFLDDDQLPQEGWLRAFVNAAHQGVKAAFGPLDPIYETPPVCNRRAVKRTFSRALPTENGSDIGRFYPYLGTGNSLFEREYCFPHTAFDSRFDLMGGEDVWMLKGLHSRNIPFTWIADAKVLEFVPQERMTFEYLRRRKYQSGQIRAILSLHPAKRRPYAIPFWMGAGAIQTAVHMSLSGLTRAFSRDLSNDFQLRAYGGMGKLFWFKSAPIASRGKPARGHP